MAELRGLVAESGSAVSAAAGRPGATGSEQALARVLAGPNGSPLDEAGFAALGQAALAERCDLLIRSCRSGLRHDASLGVESFVVFFQALLPTLGEEAAREVRSTFFRLVPTLLQMAWDEREGEGGPFRDGGEALRLLETMLLEVASVRLTPTEDELLSKSLEQLAELIAAGEYGLARDAVASPLLAILRKNRVSRSLFRLMEVEVKVQVYLKERLGHLTPRLRLPDDLQPLHEFGPIRILEDQGSDGQTARYLQVQLPDIPLLNDIVVRLSSESGASHDLRLDGLGSARLDLPAGLYDLGLIYEPAEPRPPV